MLIRAPSRLPCANLQSGWCRLQFRGRWRGRLRRQQQAAQLSYCRVLPQTNVFQMSEKSDVFCCKVSYVYFHTLHTCREQVDLAFCCIEYPRRRVCGRPRPKLPTPVVVFPSSIPALRARLFKYLALLVILLCLDIGPCVILL